MGRWVIACVALALFMLLPVSVSAQEDDGFARPTKPQIDLYQEGRKAFKAGDYADAADYFRASLSIGPLNITYLNLGRALFKAGRCKEAVQAYNSVAGAPQVPDPSPVLVISKLKEWRDELESICKEKAPEPKPDPAHKGPDAPSVDPMLVEAVGIAARSVSVSIRIGGTAAYTVAYQEQQKAARLKAEEEGIEWNEEVVLGIEEDEDDSDLSLVEDEEEPEGGGLSGSLEDDEGEYDPDEFDGDEDDFTPVLSDKAVPLTGPALKTQRKRRAGWSMMVLSAGSLVGGLVLIDRAEELAKNARNSDEEDRPALSNAADESESAAVGFFVTSGLTALIGIILFASPDEPGGATSEGGAGNALKFGIGPGGATLRGVW